MGLFLEIGLLVVLIAVNAAFSGTEMALVSLREGQLRRLDQQGSRGETVARLARDPNQFLATIQIGITLAGFLASAVAAVSLAEPLVGPLGFLGRAAEPVAVAAVTLVLAFLTLVLGELAPKRLALQRSERWALVAGRPLAGISAVSRPVVWLLSRATDLTVRVFGGDPEAHREELSSAEVRELVASTEELSTEQRAVLEGAFEVSDRRLREVLVPRTAMTAVASDRSVRDARAALLADAHSRAPVYENDLDDIVGVVHLRDLLLADDAARAESVARPAVVLPESLVVLEALRALQHAHEQLAVVVSEHGGVEGLVTVEDLLEEIVGEIYDEFDPDLRSVVPLPGGGVRLPGDFPIHDLGDVGIDLPAGDYVTVAGFVLDRLGHIPAAGAVAEADGYRVEVVEADDRSIQQVRVEPVPQAERSRSTSP